MCKLKPIIAVASIAFLFVNYASAAPFSHLWVFGDSTVDSGWYRIDPYSGNTKFDAYLPDAISDDFGKPTSSPGPISVQTLAGALGLHAKPQNQNGTNYATSGARNNESNKILTAPPSCNDVASGFFANAVPTVMQINNYLQNNGGTADGSALYVISSGGNDVSYVVSQLESSHYDPTQAQACVDDAASKLATAVATLKAQSAKYFIIANQPSSYGDADTQTYRARYNKMLSADLNSLGVNYAWGKVNAVRKLISNSQNPFQFNFTTNDHPSCTMPSGFTSSWALLCSTDINAPSSPEQHTRLLRHYSPTMSIGRRVVKRYSEAITSASPSTSGRVCFRGIRLMLPLVAATSRPCTKPWRASAK